MDTDPLSFIHVPFEVLRVIINDAFYMSPKSGSFK